MSVVRLEITVPDGQAADVANELTSRYTFGAVFDPRPSRVLVIVRTDAEAARDRDILRAAGDFLRQA